MRRILVMGDDLGLVRIALHMAQTLQAQVVVVEEAPQVEKLVHHLKMRDLDVPILTCAVEAPEPPSYASQQKYGLPKQARKFQSMKARSRR